MSSELAPVHLVCTRRGAHRRELFFTVTTEKVEDSWPGYVPDCSEPGHQYHGDGRCHAPEEHRRSQIRVIQPWTLLPDSPLGGDPVDAWIFLCPNCVSGHEHFAYGFGGKGSIRINTEKLQQKVDELRRHGLSEFDVHRYGNRRDTR